MPKKLIDDNRSYCEEYCFECCDLCPVCDCFQKLAEYENAKEQGRLLISDHKIGERMYVIVHDDIHDTYDISKHRIMDICMSGTIITDGSIGDDVSEAWTKKDQESYHVCFSMEEAEKIKAELEAKNETITSD